MHKSNSYLLMVLIFLIPLTTAGSTVVSIIVLSFWLLIADFKNDWALLKANRVALASVFIFGLHIVGLLWTEDMIWGLNMLKKSAKFMMIPIFMLYVREEHIKYYISAFLLSIIFAVLCSYGIWFEIIPPFKHATVANPATFMSHIVYNPFLVLATYILAYKIFFEGKTPNWLNLGNVFLLIAMTSNLFITGGRSGYVGFFAMICLFAFQYFNGRFYKVLICSIVICSSVFAVAFLSDGLFKKRIDKTIYNVMHYDEQKKTSVGLRLTWAINGFEVFLNHPLIGVGTGDLPNEMAKTHLINSPEVRWPKNPHNMYIMEMVQFGILGLLGLLGLFYSQIKWALSSNNCLIKHLGVALPFLYITINFAESYLSIHATGLMFAVMSAFLYRDYSLIRVMDNGWKTQENHENTSG